MPFGGRRDGGGNEPQVEGGEVWLLVVKLIPVCCHQSVDAERHCSPIDVVLL